VIPHSYGRAAKIINLHTLVPALRLLLFAAVLPVGEVGLVPQLLSTLLIFNESSLLWWHLTQWNRNRESIATKLVYSCYFASSIYWRGWGLWRVKINKQVVAVTVLLCTSKHSEILNPVQRYCTHRARAANKSFQSYRNQRFYHIPFPLSFPLERMVLHRVPFCNVLFCDTYCFVTHTVL
jgi:hypothetical protein